MKRYIFLFLSILILISCTKYAEVVMENGRTVVMPVDWGVESARNIEWSVGLLSRYTVSKGVMVAVKLPRIEDDKLSELVQKKHVDGWLIKVIRRNPNGYDTLGLYYVPLYLPLPNRILSFGLNEPMKKAFFQVNYHAAAVSERLSRMNCPAFGHRKFVTNLEVANDASNNSKLLHLSVAEVTDGNVEPFAVNMRIFSGGLSLIGTYEVQVAFYDYQTKTRKSNFLSSPKTVNVSAEEEREIEGCGLGHDDAVPR